MKRLYLAAALFPVLAFGQGSTLPYNGGNVSTSTVLPTGAVTAITLAKEASFSGVLLDAFKVAGDTDDTASFTRANTACVPILLGAQTYTVHNFTWSNGSCASFILKGVKGKSIIQRSSASGSQFFSIPAATVYIDGVVFDSNSGSISANQWGVFLAAGGQNIDIEHSVFENNSGSLGSCLAIEGSGPAAGGSFYVADNEITNCTFNPLQFGSVAHGIVTGNYVHDNSTKGAVANAFGAASSSNYATDISFIGNLFARNAGSGLTIGGCAGISCTATPYQATNISVIGNSFIDNSGYQFANQADHVSFIGNRITQSDPGVTVFGGIECQSTNALIEDNDIVLSGSSFAIDCGGAIQADIRNNKITIDFGSVDVGGNVNTTVTGNTFNLSGTGFGINIGSTEQGGGGAFPNVTSNILISGNTFNMTGSGTVGVNQFDNAGGYNGALPIRVYNNIFNVSGGGTGPFQDIKYFAYASAVDIYGNKHNGSGTAFSDPNVNGDVIVDNVFDEVRGFSSTADVRSIVPSYLSTYGDNSVILYVNPTAGGSGYTAATVLTLGTCTGSPGAWTGFPVIASGVIIGVRTTVRGSGYGTGCTMSASDSGGGSGATFNVGQDPRTPAYRKLRWYSFGNLLKSGGGYIGLATIPGWLPTVRGQAVDLQATSDGSFWVVVGYTGSWVAPTISSGFGASPTIATSFGSISFSVNVGTGGVATSGVIALGSAHNGWHCTADDVTTPAANATVQTASSTTTATLTNYSRTTGLATAWPASDILEIGCNAN